MRRILDSDREAAMSLASWCGLSPSDIDEMMCWTGVPVGEVKMAFRGETLVTRAMRNPVLRGCPICLREDAEAHNGDPAEAMAYRGHWQFREVHICLRHQHGLVPLWSRTALYERYDFASRFKEIEGELIGGRLDLALTQPTDFERWLDHRLQAGEDPCWTNAEGFYPTAVFCRCLGETILERAGQRAGGGVAEVRAAQAAGFDLVRRGPEAISEALDHLVATSPGASTEPKAAFGKLTSQVTAGNHFRPGLRDLSAPLAGLPSRNYPIAEGEDVLGRTPF